MQVRKFGERILVDVLPVLQAGLESRDDDQRVGVCVALGEILSCTTKEMVLLYAEQIVPCVRASLFDPLPTVRQSAANTFNALHNCIGSKALDDVILPLLAQLVSDWGWVL